MVVDAVHDIEESVERLLSRCRRLVLAVSGGADSAALLDAVSRLRKTDHDILVASVDHGTGEAATEATAMTLAAAARAGLPAVSERLELPRRDEASLREGRWRFLRRISNAHQSTVVTAHTLDDHIETVVMRVMRGSSFRGMAGLLAESRIERPFLELRRVATREYVRRRRVTFVEDPSNEALTYFRNRVRRQLLPAIRGVDPRFESDLLELSRRAAALRTEVNEVAARFILTEGPGLTLDARALGELSDESLWLLLPALAGHAGITLDRRGLARLADIVRSRPGSRGQLSGGFEAVRSRDGVTLSRPASVDASILRLRERGETRFGAFRFWAEPGTTIQRAQEGRKHDAWRIDIPRTAEPVVRQWHPGDRLTIDLNGGRRRVKRFFADAGIAGPMRTGWPVVICGDDVIWIPGIKASQSAVREERRMVHYTCERIRE
jgi:tRNA(Ile)-lysidine synthase